MELEDALRSLRQWADRGSGSRPPPDALEAAAKAVADGVKDGTKREVGEAVYRVEEVTWPVSQNEDGSSAFPNPRPKLALLRGDALIADIREDYSDGRAPYPIVGEKVGRWRRFRTGSPGDRGYDLHLATEEELRAFAQEADAVIAAFGVLGTEGP